MTLECLRMSTPRLLVPILIINRHPTYRSKAASETHTMTVSFRRSDVPGAQHGDLAESPGSRDFRGRFLPQNQRKIEFGLIRWAGPSLRVFTAIFLAYLQVLEVIQAVFMQKESFLTKGIRHYAFLRRYFWRIYRFGRSSRLVFMQKEPFLQKGIFGSA